MSVHNGFDISKADHMNIYYIMGMFLYISMWIEIKCNVWWTSSKKWEMCESAQFRFLV